MIVGRGTPVTPVKAKLLYDMVIGSEHRLKGEIVELSTREFRYLSNINRVEAAPAPKAK